MKSAFLRRKQLREVLAPEVAIAPRSIDQWDGFRIAYRKWTAALERFHEQLERAAERRNADIRSIQAEWEDANRAFKSLSEDTPSARRRRIGLAKKRRR